jgi:hypothetical protein
MNSPVTVGDFISHHDANVIIRKVSSRDMQKTVHSTVMDWFASEQGAKTLANFEKGGYIPAYAAYLLEYYLKLK